MIAYCRLLRLSRQEAQTINAPLLVGHRHRVGRVLSLGLVIVEERVRGQRTA
jgi:hypothetical protein